VTRGDQRARILVVDDDPTVAEVVQAYLRRFGMEPAYAADGLAALEAATAMPPDLVILDLMLPGIDGLEVCRRLRALHPLLPVIMLTALGEESDRVLGLEVGADDYVTKPFSPRELVLRVESVLRRVAPVPVPAAPAHDSSILHDGGLVFSALSRSPARHRSTAAPTVTSRPGPPPCSGSAPARR